MTISESTEMERAELLRAGAVEISRAEWLARVESYGYRVNQSDCFSYLNSHNARPYHARCVSNYEDRESGLSFAHYQGRRDSRFKELQKMRFDCFVFSRGRIFEL
jgi:hypothetical protein